MAEQADADHQKAATNPSDHSHVHKLYTKHLDIPDPNHVQKVDCSKAESDSTIATDVGHPKPSNTIYLTRCVSGGCF